MVWFMDITLFFTNEPKVVRDNTTTLLLCRFTSDDIVTILHGKYYKIKNQ